MTIIPQGKQAEVMALPAKGHIVVLGTAGSGKTTIALLRAYHLSSIPNSGKVLLVTFNGALVEYMHQICDSHSSNLVVEKYHKFARGYLNSRGKMPSRNGILDPTEKSRYICQAVRILRSKYPQESTFKRPEQFFIEEISFIEKFGFIDFDEYQKSERIGRSSANIKRENRKWIFAVYRKYLELRKSAGKKYDWDDLAFYVYKELQSDSQKRKYTHIIVDEGQDFSPMMIKSLVAAVGEGGSFTFFGDVAQQIYGSRLSWRDSGISTNKIWRFDVNYRNPTSISAFAKTITENKFWKQDADMVEATHQIAEGPKPILISFPTRQQELNWVVSRAISTSATASTAIVCRNRSDIHTFMKALKDKGCTAVEIDKDISVFLNSNKVYVTTYHSVKGLEFNHVFIPFLASEKFPDPDIISAAISKDDAYADEIKLLYVAATRSKYGLYMTYSGTLSPLFPSHSSSYDFYNKDELSSESI